MNNETPKIDPNLLEPEKKLRFADDIAVREFNDESQEDKIEQMKKHDGVLASPLKSFDNPKQIAQREDENNEENIHEQKGFFKKFFNLILGNKSEEEKKSLAEIRKEMIKSNQDNKEKKQDFISKIFNQYEDQFKDTDFYKYVENKVDKLEKGVGNFLEKNLPESSNDKVRRLNNEREKTKDRIDLDPNKNILSQLENNGVKLADFQAGLMNSKGRNPFSNEPDIRKVKINQDGIEKIIKVDYKKFLIDAVEFNLNPKNENKKISIDSDGEFYGKNQLANQGKYSLTKEDRSQIQKHQENAIKIDDRQDIKMREFAKQIGLEILQGEKNNLKQMIPRENPRANPQENTHSSNSSGTSSRGTGR
jgi:hypothetical protein